VVLREIVAENELGVVAVTEEVGLSYGFDFVVVEFESLFVCELDHAIL